MQIKSDKSSMPYLLGLFASLPIIFRGIFFESDYFIFAIIAAITVICALCFGRTRLKISSITDYALLALVLSYICTLFTAVSLYSAVLEISRYLLFFLLYLLAKSTFDKNEKIASALRIIMYVLAFSALYTLLSATGVLGNLTFPGAYSSAEHERWLQGTVQYHNTFGILMLVGFFMACGLNTAERNSKSFFANGICSFLFMFGLLMSYSRGAWVLVPFLFVPYLIFAASLQKVRFFATGIASLASVLLCLPLFSGYVITERSGMAFLTLLIGILIFAGVYYVTHLLFDKWSKTKNFKKVGISLLALIIVCAVLIVFVPALTNLLPAQLADRLSGISLGGETVKERFVFYGDAFELYKNHNIVFGNGGSAWAHLYGMYQSYDYASSQAHSYIMQVLVEAGALGFICWVAVIVLFILSCIKAYKNAMVDKNLLAVLACTGLGLILHSFIDFDLSLPAVLCLLWIVFAMLNGIAPLSAKTVTLNKWIGVVLAALLLIFSFPGWIAFESYSACNEGLEAEEVDFEACRNNAESASALMPFNGRYTSLALRMNALTNQKISAKDADEIRNDNRFEVAVMENLFYCYEAIKDYSGAYACVENIVQLQPSIDTNYLSLTDVSKVAMVYELRNGRFSEANRIASSYLSYQEEALRAAKASGEADLKTAGQTLEFATDLKEANPKDYVTATDFMFSRVKKAIEQKAEKEILANHYGEYAIVAGMAMQQLPAEGDYMGAQMVALKVTEEASSLQSAIQYAPQYREEIERAIEYAESLLSALGGL